MGFHHSESIPVVHERRYRTTGRQEKRAVIRGAWFGRKREPFLKIEEGGVRKRCKSGKKRVGIRAGSKRWN